MLIAALQGISMTLEQFSTFVELLPQIEKALIKRGDKVPRPNYGSQNDPDAMTEDGSSREQSHHIEHKNPEAASKVKKGKANFESTSEEED